MRHHAHARRSGHVYLQRYKGFPIRDEVTSSLCGGRQRGTGTFWPFLILHHFLFLRRRFVVDDRFKLFCQILDAFFGRVAIVF